MARVINFNPGPAALPLPALERAQKELLDFEGTGMSIMEHSHRGKAYASVHQGAISLIRELLKVPDTYDVLLVQGGASQQFALVPMNLLKDGKSADYVVTGSWSKKALKEAKQVAKARVAASTEVDGKFPRVPTQSELDLDPAAGYVHITSNNTIAGTQWQSFPNTGSVPLVCDMSSDIMSRPVDIKKFGLIYAGAQKNLGPSGVTVVIVRKDLVEGGRSDIANVFQYRTHASNDSLYNTPPGFNIYMVRNVLQAVSAEGGLSAMQEVNQKKADLIYSALQERSDFYSSPVEEGSRSLMNVVFNLKTPELEAEFIAEAQKQGMVGLKGHRSVGGVRASIYNAVPLSGVQSLADFMLKFRAK